MWRYVILHPLSPFLQQSGHERLCESTLCSGHSCLSPFIIWVRIRGPKLFKNVLPAPTSGEEARDLKWWRRKRRYTVEQTGPHSPMEASPSLFGQTFVGTVQNVSVCSPPPTRSI